MPPVSPNGERREMSQAEWLRGISDDIDPAKHAGEGWFATDEYARPEDVENPYTRGEITHEDAYYPGPDRTRQWRGY